MKHRITKRISVVFLGIVALTLAGCSTTPAADKPADEIVRALQNTDSGAYRSAMEKYFPGTDTQTCLVKSDGGALPNGGYATQTVLGVVGISVFSDVTNTSTNLFTYTAAQSTAPGGYSFSVLSAMGSALVPATTGFLYNGETFPDGCLLVPGGKYSVTIPDTQGWFDSKPMLCSPDLSDCPPVAKLTAKGIAGARAMAIAHMPDWVQSASLVIPSSVKILGATEPPTVDGLSITVPISVDFTHTDLVVDLSLCTVEGGVLSSDHQSCLKRETNYKVQQVLNLANGKWEYNLNSSH